MTDLTEATEASPGMGHNQPEPDIDEVFRKWEARTNQLVDTADRWLKERPTLKTADEAGKAKDFIDQLQKAFKAVDEKRAELKKPHSDAATAVDKQWNPLKILLDTCKKRLTPARADWLRREEARLAAEKKAEEEAAAKAIEEAEAKRKAAEDTGSIRDAVAAEEAAKQAEAAVEQAVKPAARAQVKGDYSTRAVGLTTYHEATVEDPVEVLAHFWQHGDAGAKGRVAELALSLAKAAMREARGDAKIPGATYKPERR